MMGRKGDRGRTRSSPPVQPLGRSVLRSAPSLTGDRSAFVSLSCELAVIGFLSDPVLPTALGGGLPVVGRVFCHSPHQRKRQPSGNRTRKMKIPITRALADARLPQSPISFDTILTTSMERTLPRKLLCYSSPQGRCQRGADRTFAIPRPAARRLRVRSFRLR